MRTEGIAVGHVDTGGTRARKIEFKPYEGRARSTYVSEAPPLALAPVPACGGDKGVLTLLSDSGISLKVGTVAVDGESEEADTLDVELRRERE